MSIVKKFARVSCIIAAQTARPGGVAGVRPCDLSMFDSAAQLEPADLRIAAESLGTTYADILISDLRWPTCNQPAAIHAAGLVVDRAIAGIVAILDGGADFKPHTRMMAGTIYAAFWNSMPNSAKTKGN